MNIEQALVAELLDTAAVTALVSDRIDPGIRPEGSAFPSISLRRISGPVEYTLASQAPRASPRFQIDCWGSTYSSAKDVADTVRSALKTFSGTMGGVSGVNVIAIWFENEIDLYEDESKVHHVAMDIRMLHDL